MGGVEFVHLDFCNTPLFTFPEKPFFKFFHLMSHRKTLSIFRLIQVEQSAQLKRTAVFKHFYALRNLENKI